MSLQRQIFYHRPFDGFGTPAYLGPPQNANDKGYADPYWIGPAETKKRFRPRPLPPVYDAAADDTAALVGPRLPPSFGSDMGTPYGTPTDAAGNPIADTAAAKDGSISSMIGDIPPLYLIGGAAAIYFLFLHKKKR